MLARWKRRPAWKATYLWRCWLRKKALERLLPAGRIKIRRRRRGFAAMPRNRSKPKKKLKTHRGAAKRFKITGTGKILRMHSGKRHLMGTKAPKRMRKLKKITQVSKADKLKTMQ